jgi:hypothetical protein
MSSRFGPGRTHSGLILAAKRRIRAPLAVVNETAMSNGRNGNRLAELERRLWALADQLWVSRSGKRSVAIHSLCGNIHRSTTPSTRMPKLISGALGVLELKRET